MKNMKKSIALVLALVLVVGGVVGGTIAWLTDETEEIKNTFTVGNIDIELAETTTNYKMIPGETLKKDPVVTVKAGSEDCWLFVKIDESANLDDFISYEVAADWTALDGVDGVYYCKAEAGDELSVLKGDVVTVKDTVTKPMMDAITAGNAKEPTLTFTAYAIQQAGSADADAAWAKINE